MSREKFTKKDLRHDAFSEGIAKAYGFLQERFLSVALVIVILAAAVLGTIYVRQSQDRSSGEASQLMYRVTQQYNMGAYGECLLSIEELLGRFAGRPEGKAALYLAGASHLALGENDAAVDRFREYLQKEPKGFYALSARSGLGLALEARGELDEAAATMDELRGMLEPADAMYTSTCFAEARVLKDLGRFSDAVEVLQPLLEGDDFQARQEAESRIAVLQALATAS